MWPKGLLNSVSSSDLGPQANIIQWTILIGSLLSIILLIMLILRKLFLATFPSYHWMLAKQTIKSSSKLAASDCCQSRRHRHSTVLMGANPEIGANLQHHPPHHMCYAWRRDRPPQPLSGCKQLDGQPVYQQYLVDSNGRHLLAGGSSWSAKFNTDQATKRDFYLENSPKSLSNSTSSRGNNRIRDDPMMEDVNSMISTNYNYDTLNGSFIQQQAKAPDDVGKLTTTTTIANSNPLQARLPTSAKSNTSIEWTLPEGAQSKNLGMNPANEDETREGKHRSPNVPLITNKTTDQLEEKSCSNSRSSSIVMLSSGDSPSSQSTTAQMLSQAASSSFEQTPELTFDCSSAIIHNGSPASLNGKPRFNPGQAKLACLPSQSAQSQPNSPMFINQLSSIKTNNNNGPFGARFKPVVAGNRALQNSIRTQRSMSRDNKESDENIRFTKQVDFEAANRCTQNEEEPKVANNCDNIDDRHYYEEIISQQH